jgi:hypothetical protein
VGYAAEEEEGYENRRFQAKGVEKSRYSGPSAEDMYTDLIESTTHILMGKESQITR